MQVHSLQSITPCILLQLHARLSSQVPTSKMNSSLLLTLVLLLLSVSPLAAFRPAFTDCVGDIPYAANSTYEANLRRLAAVLPAASNRSYTYRAVGFWPNRVQASSTCRRDDDNSSAYITGVFCDGISCGSDDDGRYSSCAACITGAFRELESACPYHKEAFFSDRNCSLELSEFRILGTDGVFERNILAPILASGWIFQVVGFAWLFFLLLQEWRGRKRGTEMLSTPPVAGDH